MICRLLDEDSLELMYKACRVSPDLDSQLSLPRSYTLPREFKYYKRSRRKPVRTEHFVPSTNSSDGKEKTRPLLGTDWRTFGMTGKAENLTSEEILENLKFFLVNWREI